MKSLLITVLSLSVQFSACLGMALATQPALASTVDVVEVEEPMSPTFTHGDVCEKAVTAWKIAQPGEQTGCQDTTSCLQGSSHSVRERAVSLSSQTVYLSHPTPFPGEGYSDPSVQEHVFGLFGPISHRAILPLFLTAQRE